VDVSVEAHQAVQVASAPPTTGVDARQVKATPGVDVAEAPSTPTARCSTTRASDQANGPPTLCLDRPTSAWALDYVSGGAPKTPTSLDRPRRRRSTTSWSAAVTVQRRAGKQYAVSGVATLGGSDSLGGSRMVVMTLPEAQQRRPRRL
jgi:hypothetical protein